MNHQELFIITGLSGSGKSTAMAAFEDAGFYCVDNMPIELLPKFLDLPLENDAGINGFAFVMDIRASRFLSQFSSILTALKKKGHRPEIIFLEADENTLLKRYSQTRRHHPVSQDKSLIESIKSEKTAMAPIRRVSKRVIDTSIYNVHKLKAEIQALAERHSHKRVSMKINVLSFGFKYGIPFDADLVIDMRFLSNPFFVPELKEQNGESVDVQKFVLSTGPAKIFLEKYLNLLDYLIPLYTQEGKAYLTIAVGCTGGRHRSVAIARNIFEHLGQKGFEPGIIHRDIDRDIKEQ
jgi:UPF0042 nucleotide-binding protein